MLHTKSVSLVSVGLASLLCMSLFACGTSRQDPARVVEAELAARQARQEESARLLQKALDAYGDKDTDEARKHLREAVALDDRNVRAWMALGALEYREDRLYEAAQAFDKAARLAPARYEPHFDLGLVYESAGLCRKAAEAYEVALKRDPDRVEVMENLARCYLTSRTQPERARELVNRALKLELCPEWLQWLESQSERLGRASEPGVPDIPAIAPAAETQPADCEG